MKPIDLDDLSRHSHWLEGWLTEKVSRTYPGARERYRLQYTKTEYEAKYGSLLEALDTCPNMTYEAIREIELEGDQEVAMSVGQQLYLAPLREAMDLSVNALLRYLRAEAMLTGSVVDLGCGYGYTLHRLGQCVRGNVTFRGGELTQAGVSLGQRLGADIHSFDFLQKDVCIPLEKTETASVVTTSFALHQLPSAAPAVELLSQYREVIDSVACLEPVDEHFGTGLLGLLRRRYGEINDYSADLLQVLSSRRDVKIEVVEPAAVGANALLPASVVVWRFV